MSYTAEKIIGQGSFGVVFLARVVETSELVAIKKVLQDRRFKVQTHYLDVLFQWTWCLSVYMYLLLAQKTPPLFFVIIIIPPWNPRIASFR